MVNPSRLRSRERAFDKDAPRTPAPPSEWFVRKRTAASKAKRAAAFGMQIAVTELEPHGVWVLV